jgi:hypothetical protein
VSENRLLEASGGRANDEQNKQRKLFLQFTWGHILRFLFQKLLHKYCALPLCVCVCVLLLIPLLLQCFVALHTSQLGPSNGLKIINLYHGESGLLGCDDMLAGTT